MSVNGSGSMMVSVVVGHGSTKVMTKVAVADIVPTVPVISNVYWPGL